MADEREWTLEERGQELMKFIGEDGPIVNPVDLDNALYTANEAYLWPDPDVTVSAEQALMCWMLIEKLRGARAASRGGSVIYAPPEDACLTCDCAPCQCGTPYDEWEPEETEL